MDGRDVLFTAEDRLFLAAAIMSFGLIIVKALSTLAVRMKNAGGNLKRIVSMKLCSR